MIKKNVLIVVSSLGIGGMEKFALQLFRGATSSELHFDFLIFDDTRLDYLDEVQKLGARVFIYKQKKSKLKFMNEMLFVNGVLKKNHYDLIYINSCSLKGLITSVVPAKHNNIKVITHAHSVGYESKGKFDLLMRKLMINYISRSADIGYSCSMNAAVSKYNQKFLMSGKYKTIANAVNVDDYSFNPEIRNRLRTSLHIDDKIVVGIIGRLENEKNHMFLFNVIKQMIKTNSNYVLLIIGGGSLEQKLKEAVQSLGVENNVLFLGARTDANQWYSAMDSFVLPSIYEGFPYVLVEAQMNGLQCFISDNITPDVDISETIQFISIDEEDSVNKWSDALLNNGSKRIGNGNTQIVKDKFDVRNVISIIVKDILDL